MSQGFGGNAYRYDGQMAILSTAQQIPFPSNGGVLAGANIGAPAPGQFTGLEGAVRSLVANDDIYIGPTANVTALNGRWIAANTVYETKSRAPIYFVGKTGAGTSSSSSGSGAPITYGTLYWSEECE